MQLLPSDKKNSAQKSDICLSVFIFTEQDISPRQIYNNGYEPNFIMYVC